VTATSGAVGIADRSASTAYRLLWLAVVFDVLAFGVGFGWDRRWHATHPFEDFFSPPHLFVYSMHFLATLTLMWITFMPDLRVHFGRAFRLFPFPFLVPGAIAIAGGGFVVTAIAGVFDAIWHTMFGLDETAWSFPHSMLGWGIFVAFVGIVACRIAIADRFPIGWPSAIVFGFLLIAASIERIPGPFLNNISIAELEIIRRIPVLAIEPPFQHTIRIYEAYDITRLNSLFIPLAAAGGGLGIRLLQRFDPRPAVIIALTAFVSYTATWVPYVVPGAIMAVAGPRITSWRRLGAAGFAFGLSAAVVSLAISRGAGLPVSGALVAMVTFALGAWLADRVWMVVTDRSAAACSPSWSSRGSARPRSPARSTSTCARTRRSGDVPDVLPGPAARAGRRAR
jgi:hypothetical protein